MTPTAIQSVLPILNSARPATLLKAADPTDRTGRPAAPVEAFAMTTTATTPDQNDRTLRDLAVEFVGMAFFTPLLKQARNNPFRLEQFHGGFAEDAFAGRLDSQLARRMARQDKTGLVETIIHRYRPHVADGPAFTPTTGVDVDA